MPHNVLIVDDSATIRNMVKRTMGMIGLDIGEVYEASNGIEALAQLSDHLVSVMVVDINMPTMNGIQLLARAKEIQPEATRVLLTGHADKQSAIQAINEIGLYQYLEKPWDNAQLGLVIGSGIERTRLLRNLRDKIAELDAAHSNLKEVQTRLLRAFL